MPVSNHSSPSLSKKIPLKGANLSCNSRLCEAKSLQKNLVCGRIEKTGFEKPLVNKIRTSLDFDNAEMENSVLSLVKESMSTFNEQEFIKNHQAFSSTSGCSNSFAEFRRRM
ncbi:hypothetical protein VIGAN_09019200 [Vigna angularis var. angularis]|uniref:Uncharacterized protein n=1 Tax=Vigna angularis var. angularis TaxID=157739 RepID=A0A0S3SW39_PHAAN|nr:hypothetical protein VIGAN_09019200 [Vigna angularis var. angularis]